MINEDVKRLRRAWSWEFESWVKRVYALPVALISSEDRSSSYSMDRASVFKLEGGEYLVAIEQGCSCYFVSEARLELFPTKAEALYSFRRWQKNAYEGNTT
jgi:hypothetical protein